VPCNWFQCQENSIDPVHFEWLHTNWSRVLRGGEGAPAPTHTRLGFDEFDFGFVYRRVREDTTEEDELWTTGRVCLWPNALYTGHFEWRVPVDDENTLSVGWFIDLVPGDAPFEQERIPCWTAPVVDAATGRWLDSHVMNQDFVAWVGQGRIADRTREHLGESDRGILMMRKRMFEEIEVVRAGGDPLGTIRDPAANQRVHLPLIGDGGRATAGGEGPPPFPFLAGQPQEIIDEQRRVWSERRRPVTEAAS
jgi:5,5'-dehydrodivanillate O-demethylase